MNKRIICRVELIPNYIWSILATADLWDTKTLTNIPNYDTRDMDILFKYRDLIKWGNGRVGALTNLLFFHPLAKGEMSADEYLNFLAEIKEGLLYEEAKVLNLLRFKSLTKQGFDEIRPIIIKIIEVFKRNLHIYIDEVWEFHKEILNNKKLEMDTLLNQEDMIGKWEIFLGVKFPGDVFDIILSYDNSKMPSANNLSRTRYNFYYNDNLVNFLQHEIGTNLLGESMSSLYDDKDMLDSAILDNNLIWLAFESLAEYIKGILFYQRDVWEGEMFGGGKYNFVWFFQHYEKSITIPLTESPRAIMKRAVLSYIKEGV